MTPSNVAKELLFNIFPALLSLMSDPRDSLNASVRKTLLAVYAAYQHWWTLSGGDKYSAYGQLCHEMNDQIETFLKSSNIGRHQVLMHRQRVPEQHGISDNVKTTDD